MNSFFSSLKKIKKVVDQVKDITQESAPSTARQSAQKTSQVTPMPELITPADVARATDLPFDTANPYEDDSWIGTTITCSDPKIGAYYELRMAKMDESGYEKGDQAWGYVREVAPDQEELSSLGNEAFRTGEAIYFRQGKHVFNSFANLPQPAFLIVEKLARLALSRL